MNNSIPVSFGRKPTKLKPNTIKQQEQTTTPTNPLKGKGTGKKVY